ncbi:Cytidine deaminase, homotetrameric [Carpediemonas membranifera]|uniref:Cytidine deaminase n=1 Tax=Carpediemonas membranifera TaxID=201153 RepID=A0A8J6B5Y6_9EUKA|nr:Cytidine deaminase, homotetrameric [Carpediemonas membranifera]|eukprot:KAG9396363.1 Cytidine deaminase, homotetrameric [Carpediemonas membranifera]
MSVSQQLQRELLDKAIEASKNAYVPYSNYSVGACLQCADGTIFTGCNVENASYGLSNCAERTTMFKAVSEGHRDHSIIAIVTRDGGLPCAACRQVMREFNKEMIVICGYIDGRVNRVFTLEELLPHSFGPENLEALE